MCNGCNQGTRYMHGSGLLRGIGCIALLLLLPTYVEHLVCWFNGDADPYYFAKHTELLVATIVALFLGNLLGNRSP